MSDLLAQVPLTVSPFVSLPTAPSLPYTYRSLPSTLPPSAVELAQANVTSGAATASDGKPRFLVSSSGTASHPDEIIASCRSLEKHLKEVKEDAEKKLKEWQEGIKQRELAEKRRIAPGYLDTEEKILRPEVKKGKEPQQDLMTGSEDMQEAAGAGKAMGDEGEELDRAFASMGVR